MDIVDLIDRQIIAELCEAKEQLIALRQPIDAATLAHKIGRKHPMGVLVVIARQNAWAQLGLNKEVECAGPQRTYH